MRKLVYGLSVGILAWAAVVVPLPVLALGPVPARPVGEIVALREPSTRIPSDLLFTAVSVEPVSTVSTVAVLLDQHRDLTFAPTVVPPGVDPDEFAELQRRLLEESVRTAAAVGLRAAGLDVTISGSGARVVQTVPGTPAADQLQQGDVIVSVDGEPVELASQVASIISQREPGDEVEVSIQRGDETLSRTIEVRELSATGGPGIGVLARTVDLEIQTPVEVTAKAEGQVGGSSAGLMIALTVYDAETEGDLTGGRTVAGTGSIDLSGNVGRISGVAEKVRGAELSGADIFLVPEQQAEEARASAPDGMEVVAVATLQEAIDALEGA